MSIEEFESMPHPFGWKVEYYNGKAHFTPRPMNVRTKLSLANEIPLNCSDVVSIDATLTE